MSSEVHVGARTFAAVRALLYAAAFVLLWSWVITWAVRFDEGLAVVLPAWLRILGMLLIVAGAALLAWSIGAFVLIGRGTPAPFDAPRRFVATGPYRYVRNPMYLGAISVILGVGLVQRSPATVGVALLFLALAHLFAVLYEERTLERQFGESYRRYKASVPRWLPRPPRSSDAPRSHERQAPGPSR
jgi:protein-S-isoprenylcysteine O-methyltransferase Ste14